jgi:formamidopyrimidine-DNA glycosylase
VETRRHGKYLFVRSGGGDWLVLHFGMSGSLLYGGRARPVPEYVRVVFEFSGGGRLWVQCRRMLGHVGLTDDYRATVRDHDLGPDALDNTLTEKDFAARFAERRGMIKPALMDQSLIAGIGNECSDEILFQARIHPRTKVTDISDKSLAGLHGVMRDVLETLKECVGGHREMPDNYLSSHRQKDGCCPTCGKELERVSAGGRKGYACTNCQHKPGAED